MAVCLVADVCLFGCRYLFVWLPMLVCLVADVWCVPLSSLMINDLMFVVLPSEGRRFEGRRLKVEGLKVDVLWLI